MGLALASDTNDLITHQKTPQVFDVSAALARLRMQANLALPLEEEETLLQQLTEFKLGHFLLTNRGLNGYWIAYAILHGIQKSDLSSLEHWFLHKAPIVKSTQERYQIFKTQLQKHVTNDVKMASIPCGLMDDLLCLNYSDVQGTEITGIDLDEESLHLAFENSKEYNVKNIQFMNRDAWNLRITNEYDLITSNGLNIYEPDDGKVIDLYKEFYAALKVGGTLITSFLTPSPLMSAESTWKNFDMADIMKQKAILIDIVQVVWQQAYRTEAQTRQQLEAAGFTVQEVIYDSQGMFPTVLARK